MEVISETVLVSAEVVEALCNNQAGCEDYCLDACSCTGNEVC